MAQEIRGDLGNTRCPEIIKVISLGRRTGCLALSNGAEKANLFFQEGEIINAKVGPLEGLKAIFEVALWNSGDYVFIVDEMPEYPNVMKPIDEILQDVNERVRQMDLLSSTITSTATVYELEPEIGDKEVNIKAVQWRTLALVNGQRSLADVAQQLGLTDFDALKVFYTLIKLGVIREKIKTEASERPASITRAIVQNAFSAAITANLTEAIGPIAPFVMRECAEEMRFDLNSPDPEANAIFIESLATRIPDETIALGFLTGMTTWLKTGA